MPVTGLVTAPAPVMPLAAVAFSALKAWLAEAEALTTLPATATLALPAVEEVSTFKAPVTVAPMATPVPVVLCTLLMTPEASRRLVAARVSVLDAVLALAVAATVLSLSGTVPPEKAPLVTKPLAPVFRVAVTAVLVSCSLMTEKSTPLAVITPSAQVLQMMS